MYKTSKSSINEVPALDAESVCTVELTYSSKDASVKFLCHQIKKNRTAAVKYAYTRIFNPDWAKEKISFIQNIVSKYNYSTSLKETFNFSLCSRCNSTL